MFKKLIISAVIVLVFCQLITGTVLAQTDLGERIDNYLVSIQVNQDASINVTETITYNTGGEEKHGIYRDLRTKSASGQDLEISDINVSNATFAINKPAIFTDVLRIKIGDPDVTFSGERVYYISYKVKGAIGYFANKGFDEVYWNVTGNDWTFPINQTSVDVQLFAGTKPLQSHSYCGTLGSDLECTKVNDLEFTSTGPLLPGSGFTVAVGFETGLLAKPKISDTIVIFFSKYWFILVSAGLAYLWHRKRFVEFFRRQSFYNKYPIVAEYDAGGFNVFESSILVDRYYRNECLPAMIVSLAIAGYLKIEIRNGEFYFKKLKEADSLLKEEEKALLDLVADKSETTIKNFVKVSRDYDIKTVFIPTTNRLISQNYVSRFSTVIGSSLTSNYSGKVFMSLFFAVNPGIFVVLFVYPFFGFPVSLIFSCTCLFIGLLYLLLKSVDGVGITIKGLEGERKLLGLKLYIDTAEKDRINFHNQPAKTPELFEKLLPFAMLFRLEKKWVGEFEGIFKEVQAWSGQDISTGSSFINFSSSLGNLSSSFALSNFVIVRYSSSSRSGSSGGGSSGGGGGGGGGGSW